MSEDETPKEIRVGTSMIHDTVIRLCIIEHALRFPEERVLRCDLEIQLQELDRSIETLRSVIGLLRELKEKVDG